jgi:hypothetical protein
MATRRDNYNEGRERTATALPASLSAHCPSLRDQGIEATRQLREALHLPFDVSDASILGTALARAAVGEMKRNPGFAREVRRHYDELQMQRGTKSKSGSRHIQPLEPLVAIRHTGGDIDPFAPPDPQVLK